MKSLTIKHLKKTVPAGTLFADVSFTVTRSDRVAILGANGTGKSTLLQIIAGHEPADSGRVTSDNAPVTYVPQTFDGALTDTPLAYLDRSGASSRAFDISTRFGAITESELAEKTLAMLSGGQRRVLQLAAAFSRTPLFLCLDEPENHLDLPARAVLTELMRTYSGAILFVSHDRHLVDAVATTLVHLKNQRATCATGKSYATFFAEDTLQTGGALARWKAEAQALKRLEASVRMLKRRTRYNDAQAQTYQMKKRELAERRTALGPKPELEPATPQLTLGSVQTKSGKLIVRSEDVSIAYTDHTPVLKSVSLDVRFGDRLVILGRNGSGKTSLINVLTGALTPRSGTVQFGKDITTATIDQHATLDHTKSPLAHFLAIGYPEERARSILAQFHFSRYESETALSLLSGGQQQRVAFLLLFTRNPEFIILDEPTNNLDPTVWQLLLQLVNTYRGTLLLISHDRVFLEGIERARYLLLINGTLTESWDPLETTLAQL